MLPLVALHQAKYKQFFELCSHPDAWTMPLLGVVTGTHMWVYAHCFNTQDDARQPQGTDSLRLYLQELSLHKHLVCMLLVWCNSCLYGAREYFL